MKKHECFIGLFYDSDYADLITLNGLKSKIKWNKAYNAFINNDPEVYRATWALRQEWTLKDYCDRRKSTNLCQFDFCPVCGKQIDWKTIRRLEDDKI